MARIKTALFALAMLWALPALALGPGNSGVGGTGGGGGGAPSGPAGGDLAGTYPNPTVNSVANVNQGVLKLFNGGTQCGAPAVFASLPAVPVTGMICTVTDATACTSGSPITVGGGTTACQAFYNGTAWVPAGNAIGGPPTGAAGGGLGGSYPNPTVLSVASVTTGVLKVLNGGTQCGAPTTFAGLPGAPTNGEICNVTDATLCTVGTAVTVGGGALKCQITYNGASWFPAGGASSGGGPPTGTAGGDLGGTYPAPTLLSVANVTTGVLKVANGGRQCGAPSTFAGLPASPTNGESCSITDANTCLLGTNITAGGGAVKCQITYNGTNWQAGGGATGGPPTGAAAGDLGGTYPNPTVLSVADVTTGILKVLNGGTQCAGPSTFAALPGSPTKGEICTVTDTVACLAGTPIIAGGGTTNCQVFYDGTNWQPAGGANCGSSSPSGAAGGDLGGTYPNPTVLSVADVTTGILGLGNGGTQCGAPTVFASLPASPTFGMICGVTDAPSCVNGTAVTSGGGTNKCQVTYSGVSWFPTGGMSSPPAGTAGGDLGGSYPNPTVLSVADVTTGVLKVTNGGTQCAGPTTFAGLPASPTNGEMCNVTDATACTVGTAVTVGGGSIKCQVTYNGTNWNPAGGAASGGGPPTGTAGGDLGGTYPNPTLLSVAHVTTGILPLANGGTQCGAATIFGSLPGSPIVGQTCTVTDAPACSAGVSVTVGGGTNKCQLTWNGTHWLPAGGASSGAIAVNGPWIDITNTPYFAACDGTTDDTAAFAAAAANGGGYYVPDHKTCETQLFTPGPAAVPITNITESGTTATMTLADAAFALFTGKSITITGNSVGGYNSTFTVTRTSPTVFTFTATASLGTGTGGQINWTGLPQTWEGGNKTTSIIDLRGTTTILNTPCSLSGLNNGVAFGGLFQDWNVLDTTFRDLTFRQEGNFTAAGGCILAVGDQPVNARASFYNDSFTPNQTASANSPICVYGAGGLDTLVMKQFDTGTFSQLTSCIQQIVINTSTNNIDLEDGNIQPNADNIAAGAFGASQPQIVENNLAGGGSATTTFHNLRLTKNANGISFLGANQAEVSAIYGASVPTGTLNSWWVPGIVYSQGDWVLAKSVQTTGTTNGTTSVTSVASVTHIWPGIPITVSCAAAGANLTTYVTAVVGSTVTLANACTTSGSGVNIEVPNYSGHVYRATVAGTGGTTVPAFPTAFQGTVPDGGATLMEYGPGAMVYSASNQPVHVHDILPFKGFVGVALSSTNANTVHDVECDGNQVICIWANNASGGSIFDNDVEAGAAQDIAGIQFQGTPSNVKVWGNTITVSTKREDGISMNNSAVTNPSAGEVTDVVNDVSGTPAGLGSWRFTNCKADIPLVAGAGSFAKYCVTTNSSCIAQDVTTAANACTLALPGAGSVAITGTGTDTCRVTCF